MDIPDYLEQQIKEGKVALCLGSGASLGAKDDKGKGPPVGKGLAELLANKFLGGKYKDSPLAQVAEYAISESDLGQVQSFIRDLLEPLQPTSAHVALATFPWWGIATTNYDRPHRGLHGRTPHDARARFAQTLTSNTAPRV